MKKFVLLASVLFSLQFAAACGALAGLGAPAVKEFKSDAGGFSVNVPGGTMQETSQNVPTAAGNIKITLYQTTAGNNAYLAGFSDFPDAITKQNNPDTLLDGARQGAVTNANGTVVSDNKITFENNPGRETVIDGKAPTGQEATIKVRYYLINNRLYQVMAVTPRGQINSAGIDDFLQSFKLTK